MSLGTLSTIRALISLHFGNREQKLKFDKNVYWGAPFGTPTMNSESPETVKASTGHPNGGAWL